MRTRTAYLHFTRVCRSPSEQEACYRDLMAKADLCAAALLEARRLGSSAQFSSLFAQVVGRIRDMLDELDNRLLLIDVSRDRRAYERVAALHAEYEELEYRRDHLGV